MRAPTRTNLLIPGWVLAWAAVATLCADSEREALAQTRSSARTSARRSVDPPREWARCEHDGECVVVADDLCGHFAVSRVHEADARELVERRRRELRGGGGVVCDPCPPPTTFCPADPDPGDSYRRCRLRFDGEASACRNRPPRPRPRR